MKNTLLKLGVCVSLLGITPFVSTISSVQAERKVEHKVIKMRQELFQFLS